MTFNFDLVKDRKNSYSVKWDIDEGPVIPLWVADMDFKTAPPIIQALEKRAASGIYGYTLVPKDYKQAVKSWWDKRFSVQIKEEWIQLANGVIPALSAVLEALLDPGQAVLIQTPVYNYFEKAVRQQGCALHTNPLVHTDQGYQVDWKDFEDKLALEETKIFLLCNPHNPVGRVFSKEELRQMGQLCAKYGVFVVADEIHRDLVYPPNIYEPYMFSHPGFLESSLTLSSPSKTFNLAGLKTANMLIANPEVRKKLVRVLDRNETSEPNVFGVDGLIAAYEEGEAWLEELLIYLKKNMDFTQGFLKEHLPHIKMTSPEATYLVWLDCRAYAASSQDIYHKLLEKSKVRVNPGHIYGEGGQGFIRLNVACPRSILEEGLERLVKGFQGLDLRS